MRPPRRLSYYPFAISTILLITNIVVAKFFNPILSCPWVTLNCALKKLKRKLKLQSTFKGNKMQVISTASKTSVATTDAIFDCHDSSDNFFQKSYCTSRGLQLYLFERNLLSFSVWAAFFLFSGSDCRNNFCFIIPHNSRCKQTQKITSY